MEYHFTQVVIFSPGFDFTAFFAAVKWSFENKALQWLVLLALAFTWGSSFILMKRGLLYYDNNQVAAIRITLASLVLLPVALRSFGKVKPKNLMPIFAVGLLGNFIPAFVFTKAQTVLSSSLTGMLNSLVPLFTLISGVLLFKAGTNRKSVIGVAIGLAGAIGLIATKGEVKLAENYLWFALLPVTGALCYALSTNIIKHFLNEVSPLVITAIAFLMVGPLSIGYLLFDGFFAAGSFQGNVWHGLIYIGILGVIGTALAVIAFNALIKQTTAVFATSVTYIIPVVAIFWGVLDGETVTPLQFLCMGLVLAGVYLVKN